MAQGAALALEYLPDLLVFRIDNYKLVNSLPYIETKLSKEKMASVNKLVHQEMKLMKAENDNQVKDYLSPLQMPVTKFLDSDRMISEYERVKNPEELQINTEAQSNFGPLDQAKINLEYSSIQKLNLDLMKEFAADELTQVQNDDMIHHIKHQINQIDGKIAKINKKRKHDQMLAFETIIKDYQRTHELINKNLLLEKEIIRLTNNGFKRQKLE